MIKKICVVGGGYWGKNHIKTLNEIGSLFGIVDTDVSQLKKYKQTYPGIDVFQNLDDALKKDFDGFIVAVPAKVHYSIGKKIINAKRHVLIEKPFCLDYGEAQNLIDLADKNAVNVMVGHLLLFHPAIIKIKELITNNKIGELYYIYSNRLNLGKVRSNEDVLWSLSPHDISIFQYFTDSFPEEIVAQGSSFIQKGIIDSSILNLKYSKGISGHIFSSWIHPFKEHRLILIGSKGMISFEDSKTGSPIIFYDKGYRVVNSIPVKIDNSFVAINYDYKPPLTEELKYFIKNIDNSKIKKSGATSALEVTKILTEASKQIYRKTK